MFDLTCHPSRVLLILVMLAIRAILPTSTGNSTKVIGALADVAVNIIVVTHTRAPVSAGVRVAFVVILRVYRHNLR